MLEDLPGPCGSFRGTARTQHHIRMSILFTSSRVFAWQTCKWTIVFRVPRVKTTLQGISSLNIIMFVRPLWFHYQYSDCITKWKYYMHQYKGKHAGNCFNICTRHQKEGSGFSSTGPLTAHGKFSIPVSGKLALTFISSSRDLFLIVLPFHLI